MSLDPKNVQEFFAQAIEFSDLQQRLAFLVERCAGDVELFRRVSELLTAFDQPKQYLDEPTVIRDNRPDDDRKEQQPGSIIAGRYKLLEAIAEGGMGTVWVAEQTKPVRRKVAIKLIKPGMDSRQVLARFDAERQALALMDHPNIAKVFDGGVTDQGRPYFAMEYVKGMPLTEYCDQVRLSVEERLKLFVPICQAVQHAHQKGIIHRDLKPSNVLICLYDGKPVPKVIDFGLAKAMHQPLTEQTLHTGHGLMLGTPLYMSPEQAEHNNLDVDTRTDVYSLGVMLYELLTGTTPLEKAQLKEAAFGEILRLIKEVEPPKPSTRVSTNAQRASIAAQRSLDPEQLGRSIRGDLDWIIMKALDKERDRRYETANGLARDIERFLSDEAVEACPPSASYRLRKFARRNARALTTAALLAVMLLVAIGAVAGSLGWMARDREARQAKLAGQLELIFDEVQQLEKEQKWPEALAAARRAEALLSAGGDDEDLNRQAQVVLDDLELVERLETIRMEQETHQSSGFEWIDGEFAAAFREFGVDLDQMTTDDAARRLGSHKAVAPALCVILDHWTLLRSLSGNAQRGRALSAVAGRLDDDPWRQRMRKVVAQIDTNVFVGDGALPGNMDPTAIEGAQRLAASPDLLRQSPSTLYRLGMMLTQGAAKPEVGATLLRKAHEQYPGDFWINSALALTLERMGAEFYEEALGYHRAALALRPDVGWTWCKIGAIQQVHKKNLDEAVACYRKAIELNANISLPHSYLGDVLKSQKKLGEATAEFRKAIELDPRSVGGHFGIGLILVEQNQVDEAVATLTKAVDLIPTSANLRWALGRALHKQKKLDEAVACFNKALEIDPKPANYHWGLGFALRDQKKSDEAVAAFRKALAIDPTQAYATYGLGLALIETKQPEEAITVFRNALELEPTRADSHQKLGALLVEQGEVAEALTCFRKAVDLEPNSAWTQMNLAFHLCTATDPQLRDPTTAVIHARKAIELKPDQPIYRSNLGLALLRAGDYKAAALALEQVEEATKDIHRYRFFLAMAYWHLGEQDKARLAYEQAVQWMDETQPVDEYQRRFRAEAAELMGIAEPAPAKAP